MISDFAIKHNALTVPVSLSILTATQGHASKRLIPDAQGAPIRDPAHSLGISAGRLAHVQVAGLTGFAALLQQVTQHQALVHGIPKGSRPGDAYTLLTAKRYAGAPGTIARTLDCLAYPPEVFLMMFDYDPDPAAPETIGSAVELMTRLITVCPPLADVGWLATTSTRSAIRDKQTEAWLRPPDGMHVYVLATGDVAHWRDWLKVHLWLAGYGFCKLATPNSQTGVAAVLERAVVDLMVFSPERLDYVAGALMPEDAPFYQDRPAPVLHAGGVLDLDALPSVTPEERQPYAVLLAAAKEQLVPERRALVRTAVTTAQPRLPAPEVEHEVTARLDLAARGELKPEHRLYFDNGTVVTAGTLVQATPLDAQRLADPQEPTYGQGHAVFHYREGDWRIVSWAHGVKRVYQLDPVHRSRSTRAAASPQAALKALLGWGGHNPWKTHNALDHPPDFVDPWLGRRDTWCGIPGTGQGGVHE
jgi:hypothetical protein